MMLERAMGLWQVHAYIAEDVSRSGAYSGSMSFKVTHTWLNHYMLYIIGSVAGFAGVSVVVFIIRRRRYKQTIMHRNRQSTSFLKVLMLNRVKGGCGAHAKKGELACGWER
jgi:hypothetical protein